MLNPIGLALTANAGTVYLVWKNWDWIGPKLTAMWTSIKGAFLSGINYVIGLLNYLPGVHLSPVGGGLPAAEQTVRPRPLVNGGGAGAIYLDGRKVGMHVTNAQSREMSRPNTSTSGFDWSRSRPAVAGGR